MLFDSMNRKRRDIKIPSCLSAPARKSNDLDPTRKCDISIFDQKFPSWENLVQKNQNCQFKLKFGI